MKNYVTRRNEIPKVEVHLECPCYQRHNKQTIRHKQVAAGEKDSIHATTHCIVFLLDGTVRISIRDTGESVTIGEDEFIFLPIGTRFDYEAFESGLLLIFSLDKSMDVITECHMFRFKRDADAIKAQFNTAGPIYPLRANDRVKHFITGTLGTEQDGLKCTSYAKLLVGQLLFLIQVYYPQETYIRFYSALFNSDVKFSDFVYNNWKRYQTAGELATAFRLGPSQFADRFVKVFGETPGSWLNNRKRTEIYYDLCNSLKSIKEVASDYNYAIPNFTRYCRTNFGATPGTIRGRLQKGSGGE